MIGLKVAGLMIYDDLAFAVSNNEPISKAIESNLTNVNYSGYPFGEVAVLSQINHLKGLNSIKTTNTSS